MNPYKYIIIIFIALNIILLPLIIISHIPASYYYSASFHDKSNEMNEIISLLFQNQDTNILTQNEKSHMLDVKNLLMISRIYLLTTITLFLILVNKKIITTKILNKSSITSLITLTLLGALITTNFSSGFKAFHEIFFPMGNYTFAQSSTLIQLFPQEFFFQTAIISMAISIIISTTTYVLTKKKLNSNYQSTS